MVTTQIRTAQTIAPSMPKVWERSTDLISPPIAIENAAPTRGRNGQFDTSHVCVPSQLPSHAQPFSRPDTMIAWYGLSTPRIGVIRLSKAALNSSLEPAHQHPDEQQRPGHRDREHDLLGHQVEAHAGGQDDAGEDQDAGADDEQGPGFRNRRAGVHQRLAFGQVPRERQCRRDAQQHDPVRRDWRCRRARR